MGAPVPCGTCVMMLAGPSALAMTYVKPSMGLDPSVYGGGGSPSSYSLLEEPSLVSLGSAAFVSATTVAAAEDEEPRRGSSDEKAGSCSVGLAGLAALWASPVVGSEGKKSDEKGGGYGESAVVDSVGSSSADVRWRPRRR